MGYHEQVAVLTQALPYIQRFRGRTVVVKYGGNAMESAELARQFAEDVVLMRSVGMKPVVVHGGGPQIGEMMSRLGKVPEFREGQRVTDAETLNIARMVLIGQVNSDIVSSLNVHGPVAVGLSGTDAGLIRAEPRDPSLGFVGNVTSVNPAIVERLLAEDLIPVIATIGADAGGQAYNINADAVAGAVAEALEAEKLIYLTDIVGLLADVSDPDSLIRQTTTDALRSMVETGALAGGMIPKIDGCVRAVSSGVASAHIIDGRVPHVLLLEVFTDRGIGTMVTLAPDAAPAAQVDRSPGSGRDPDGAAGGSPQ